MTPSWPRRFGASPAPRARPHYRVLVEPLTPGDATYGDLVRSHRADGAVVSGPLFDDPELSELVADGFPIVIQGNLPGSSAPSVDVDNVASARVAVDHLISLGHRADRLHHQRAAVLRRRGRSRSPATRPPSPRPASSSRPDLVAQAAFDAASGHRAMKAILARGTPDAVFVASDVVALGGDRRAPGGGADRARRRLGRSASTTSRWPPISTRP